MQKLSQNRLPKHIGAFVNLRQILSLAITQRGTFAMNKSGYPVASHAVARMQQHLDLSSMKSLLTGVMKLRDLCRFAANVLDTIPLAKVDKFQLVRTELIAYIGENAASHGVSDLSETEKDFVAYLITSAETADGAWILDFSEGDSNRVLQFEKLYRSLLSPDTITATASKTKIDYSNWDTDIHVVYDPEKDDIINIQNGRRLNNVIKEFDAKLAGLDTATSEALALDASDAINNAITIHHLAMIRVVDHVNMLLNDIGIWTAMLSPRSKADSASNAERSKSLRLAASYFHSLLMYPHIHALELFMHTYDKLQDWMKVYPALPADIIANYNHVVRSHDFLKAGDDAKSLLNLIEADNDETTGSMITGVPMEIVRAFGLTDVINEVNDAANRALLPINLTDLKLLDDEKYRYVLLSFAVAEFNMTQKFSEFLYMGHATSKEIQEAIYAVNPGLQTYYRDEIQTKLKSLAPTVPFGYSNHVALTDEVMKTTPAVLEGGKLMWRPLTPTHSYDYQYFLRHDKLFTIFGGDSIINAHSKYVPTIIINKDSAARLRRILMKENWKTMMPASLAYSDHVYNKAMLRADRNTVKRLMEDITGMNFSLLERQITAPYFKQIVATYLSGFALLYIIPNESPVKRSKDKETATEADSQAFLVVGHGKPYGTTYQNLASKQSPFKREDLIEIGYGAYIRILDEIPVPLEDLAADPDFYVSHPYYYYPSNSSTISVKEWVVTDGLLNFALAPITGNYRKPATLLDQRHAYLNDKIYIQTHMTWSIAGTMDDSFHMPLVKQSWSQDVYTPNIEYITHGEYSNSAIKLLDTDVTPINALVTDLEVNVKKIEADTPMARIEDTKPQAVDKVELTAIDEQDSLTSHSKHKPSKKSSDDVESKDKFKKKGKEEEEEEEDEDGKGKHHKK